MKILTATFFICAIGMALLHELTAAVAFCVGGIIALLYVLTEP